MIGTVFFFIVSEKLLLKTRESINTILFASNNSLSFRSYESFSIISTSCDESSHY